MCPCLREALPHVPRAKLAARAIFLLAFLLAARPALNAQQVAPNAGRPVLQQASAVTAPAPEPGSAASADASPAAADSQAPPLADAEGADGDTADVGAPDAPPAASGSMSVSGDVNAASGSAAASNVAPASSSDPAPAQFPPEHQLVHTFLHDEYRIWTSPFRPGSYDSHTMLKYGVPFLLISGGLIASDRYTANWLPNSKSQVIWSGRISQIGAPYTLAGVTVGSYLIARITKNNHLRETSLLALEALAHSQIVGLVLKEATQRQRPFTTPQDDGFWEGGSSFPSGHALGSFAVAAVFAREYSDHVAVPIVAYSLATVVALSRIGAQQHWASDIFVGGAAGFLIGRYTYRQHHDPDLPGSPGVRTSRLRPDFEFGPNGPGLYWSF